MYSLILDYGNNNPGAYLIYQKKIIGHHFENEFTEQSDWHLVFPEMSFAALLKEREIAVSRLDCVVFCFKPFSYLERIIEKHIFLFPRSFNSFVAEFKDFVVNKLFLEDKLKKLFSFNGHVYYVDPFNAILSAAIKSSSEYNAVVVSLSDNPGATDTFVYKRINGEWMRSFGSPYPDLPLLDGLRMGSNGFKNLEIGKIACYKNERLFFKQNVFSPDRYDISLKKDYFLKDGEGRDALILEFLKGLLAHGGVSSEDKALFLSDYDLPAVVKTEVTAKYKNLSFLRKNRMNVIDDINNYSFDIVHTSNS